jgi:ABC-2 type transport system ATP-binding protein
MTARPAVHVEGLAKRFAVRRPLREVLASPAARRWTTALDGVDLEVRRGEVFGLLGANGAGKTTLFKILATLVLPDAGRATVLDLDVVADAAAVRRVLCPVIADERSLHWRLTGRANLELYAALYGLRGAAARERVAELLALVGLQDAADRPAGPYSSGMKQRLLIARALLPAPDVLLLDEPTRSMDPVAARAFREFLGAELRGRQGRTLLLATHSPDEALGLCDRLAILDRGRVLTVGTAASLRERYSDGRHRVLTDRPPAALGGAFDGRGLVQWVGDVEEVEPGWLAFDVRLERGGDAAARFLGALVSAGARVARFEPVRPSLADLIERVASRNGAGSR